MANNELNIQKAHIYDLEILFKIQKEAFKEIYETYGSFDSNPYLMDIDRLKFNINYPHGHYLKLCLGNTIIGGCFFYESDKDSYHIDQIYIDPNYQGLGYGKYLIEYILSNFKFHLLTLDTIKDSKSSKLYLELGFKIKDEEIEDGISFVNMEYLKD